MNKSTPHADSPAWKALNKKVAELAGKTFLPQELVAMVSEVARLQLAAGEAVHFTGTNGRELPPDLLKNMSNPEARLSGLPILAGKDFPLDMEATRDLALALLRTIHEVSPALAEKACILERTINGDGRFLENICKEIKDPEAAGKENSLLACWAKDHPDAPSFLRFVARSAAMPSLTLAGSLLGKEHNNESAWQHGHCPVCGNQPVMGRLEGKEGRRTHTCSFCSFEYRVPRLGCPFCLASAAEGSEYHVSDEEPGYLLDVCDVCKNYIKLADFREFDRAWVPLLDDLASLVLDFYARQMDYTRPTLSGWGF